MNGMMSLLRSEELAFGSILFFRFELWPSRRTFVIHEVCLVQSFEAFYCRERQTNTNRLGQFRFIRTC
jgi:hypothetical protein